MNWTRQGIAWLLVLAASGCSLPAPYQTYSPGEVAAPPAPENPFPVYGVTSGIQQGVSGLDSAGELSAPVAAAPIPAPTATNPAIAICYNRLWNSAEAVKSAAAAACGSGKVPHSVSAGIELNACPVLTPTRAVFACTAAP